ncbi:MAG: hypothetical protein KBS83_06155, partial [Lachnospiraceae bacterium]|nr:hypothetical protein [Candidatus Equihabitans merdae]
MESIQTSFGDPAVWTFMVQVFILVSALLFGNVLRRKIKALRVSLIPAAIIGGIILMLLKLIPGFKMMISQSTMEIIAYHCLPIGFIAMSLKRGRQESQAPFKTILATGVVQGGSYMIQAIFGLAITIIFAMTLPGGFFPGAGVLLCLGFGQGTGQALNYGKLYEGTYGFVGGTTFGLTIATVGFLVASVVGVVYMNILQRKGKLRIVGEDEKHSHNLSDYVVEGEIPNAESIDKFSVNFSLVLLIYGVTYLIMRAINVNLVWGFNFLLGVLISFLAKYVMKLLKKTKLMTRELTNDFLLDRISGFVFDMMIIAGVAAIDVTALSKMWWQLAIICTVGTIVTFIYLKMATKRLYPTYVNEAFFSLFGMMTGTASNGVILLREIDPQFRTPASSNLVLSGVPAIVFGGGLLLVLGYIPLGMKQTLISLAIL